MNRESDLRKFQVSNYSHLLVLSLSMYYLFFFPWNRSNCNFSKIDLVNP